MPRWPLGVIGAMLALAAYVGPFKLSRDASVIRVTSVPVSVGALQGAIMHAGTVRPISSISVGSAPASAVRSVEVGRGTFVHAGEILAHVDASVYRESFVSANAALEQAKEDLKRARDTADLRTNELVAELATNNAEDGSARSERIASEANVEWARQAVRSSEGQVAAAEALVAEVADERVQAVIRAPADGWVVSIGATAPLFQIAPDTDHLEVTATIDAFEAAGMHPGDPASVVAGDCEATGTIARFEVDEPERKSTVVVDVPIPLHEMPPGTAVRVSFLGGDRPQVLQVPNAALSFSPSLTVLKAADEVRVPEITLPHAMERPSRVWLYHDGSFTAIQVQTGAHDSHYTQLRDGPLRLGDRVVISATVGDK